MEKKWLIKIKGDIAGPFDEEELKTMVAEGKLSADDEVTQSCKKWIYASSMKELGLSKKEEKELTQTITSNKDIESKEKDVSPSQDDYDDITQVYTPSSSDDSIRYQDLEEVKSPVKNSQSRSDADMADEIDYELEEEKPKGSPEDQDKFHLDNQFGSLDQVKKMADTKAHQARRWAWKVIMFIFVVCGVGFLFLKIYSDLIPQKAQKGNFLQELKLYRQSMKTGEYFKAVDFLEKVSLQDPELLTSSDWVNLSALMLYTGQSSYKARIALNKSKDQGSLDQGKEVLLDAIIKFKNNFFSNADILFDRYLLIEAQSVPALLYKFLLKVKSHKVLEAQAVLNRLQSAPQRFAQNRLISFLSLYTDFILLNNISDDNGEFIEFIHSGLAYSQEAMLVSIIPKFSTTGDMNVNIQEFLDQDPYLTHEHYSDVFSPSSSLIWETLLLDVCESQYKKLSQQVNQWALYAFCQMQSGDTSSAKVSIEKALDLHPNSPLILSLYSYILTRHQMSEKSQIYLDQSLSVNSHQQFMLPYILKARWCYEKGHFECAKENWDLAGNIRNNLSVQGGKALALYQLGNKQEALQLMQEGLQSSSHYLPFLRIQVQ